MRLSKVPKRCSISLGLDVGVGAYEIAKPIEFIRHPLSVVRDFSRAVSCKRHRTLTYR
jgi:hypothetical protein